MPVTTVRVQEKGQVTIPFEIRKKLKLKKGDLVTFIETRKGIIIQPAEVVVSAALEEIGQALKEFAHVPFALVQPTKRNVLAAARYVALKDAPLVAAARKAKVDFLVTLDKKHLLGRPDLAKYIRAEIVTPKEAVIHLTRLN